MSPPSPRGRLARRQVTEQNDPAAAVRQEMQGWLQEVAALRQEVAASLPVRGSSPERFSEALLVVRAHQDRVEEILGNAVSLHHMARRWAWDHEASAEDAFDARSAQQRRSGRGNGEWTTGRERQADINLQILPEIQRTRAARRFADEIDEVLERIKAAYRGLDATRQDLGTYLRYLQWESVHER
jgi:hypothetical protein